jgi:hypothetical protein
MISAKGEMKRLRKEFNDATINYLESFSEEDHKVGLEGGENLHELLPQLTISTLEDGLSEFVRKLVDGEELNS